MKKTRSAMQEDTKMAELYAAEQAKTLKFNRITLLILSVLFVGSLAAFILSLIHRLG